MLKDFTNYSYLSSTCDSTFCSYCDVILQLQEQLNAVYRQDEIEEF